MFLLSCQVKSWLQIIIIFLYLKFGRGENLKISCGIKHGVEIKTYFRSDIICSERIQDHVIGFVLEPDPNLNLSFAK